MILHTVGAHVGVPDSQQAKSEDRTLPFFSKYCSASSILVLLAHIYIYIHILYITGMCMKMYMYVYICMSVCWCMYVDNILYIYVGAIDRPCIRLASGAHLSPSLSIYICLYI